jgi:hypothetical protein
MPSKTEGSGEVTISVLSWWKQATTPTTSHPRSKIQPAKIDNEEKAIDPPKMYAADPVSLKIA